MKIEHIAMYVNDLDSVKNFFVKYFDATANSGYHNLKTDFRSYFLSFTDGSRLEIMNKPGMADLEKILKKQEDKEDKAVAVVHIYRLNIPFTDNTIYIFYISYILVII